MDPIYGRLPEKVSRSLIPTTFGKTTFSYCDSRNGFPFLQHCVDPQEEYQYDKGFAEIELHQLWEDHDQHWPLGEDMVFTETEFLANSKRSPKHYNNLSKFSKSSYREALT